MTTSELLDVTVTASDIKPEKQEVETVAARKNLQVLADDHGVLIGKSLDEQTRLANMYLAAKDILPKQFDTLAKALSAMQFAYALGFEPVIAMRQMYYMHGCLTAFGDLPLAAVKKSGLLVEHEEYLINEKQERICFENKNLTDEIWGAVCETKRKGSAKTFQTFFTRPMAEKAGLWRNNYLKYPGDMLTYRARSRNLKSNFADALQGVQIAEYDLHENPTREVVENSHDNAQSINKMFLSKEEKK